MTKYVFYDDETQGAAQLICQVGFVVADELGNEVSSFQTLVDPHAKFDPYVVRHVHHITPSMVAGAPTFDRVWNEILLPTLEDGVLVAHSARGADLHHIRKSLEAHKIAMPQIDYVDTMDMARELFPEGPWKLARLAEHYGIDDPAHHDALNDARVLATVFAAMRSDGAHVPVHKTSTHVAKRKRERR